jgi:hypothetical protein
MAQLYANRGDADKAKQALEWSQLFETFPRDCTNVEECDDEPGAQDMLPPTSTRSS